MNVLLLTREFADNCYGGAGIHVTHLFYELKKLIDIEVGILDSGKPTQQLSSLLPTLDIAINYLNDLKQEVDLIHCHQWYSFAAGLFAKKILNKKLVVTFHSVEQLRPWKKTQVGHAYDYICWLEEQICHAADQIIAVSEQCKLDIIQSYAVPESKVCVIQNGINKKLYDTAYEIDFIKQLGINPNRPTALAISRISQQKGIDFLLETLPSLSEKWQIILCLNSPDDDVIYQQTEKKIRALPRDVIYLKAFIPNRQIKNLFQIAQVFLATSTYEPFGLTAIEALTAGCPVVARSASGFKETIMKTRGGILCDLNMPPQEFATHVNSFLDPSIHSDYVQQIRHDQIIDWRDIANATVDVYKTVLQSD